jgi:glycerophosphoryl diester phosphodiesterase
MVRLGCAVLLSLASVLSYAEEAKSLFHQRPILFGVHRGGRDLWPEDTTEAYVQAVKRWPQVLLEGDIHLTKDQQVVVLHDPTVDRTTNGTGLVKEKTLAELKQLDAGYRFTLDQGKTFPYRGKGITIPTLTEALNAVPDSLFLIELKEPLELTEPAIKAIREAKAEQRLMLASFNPLIMQQIRKIAPEINTCYDPMSATGILAALRNGEWAAYTPTNAMVSLSPEMQMKFAITDEEIQKIRAKGILVEVFTLNTPEEMNRYLDIGVDSILTDRPEVLEKVLADRAKAQSK